MLVSGPRGSFLAATIASAHTELESSTPADGDIVIDIVTEIALVFTEPVELVGEGIEVLLPSEQISDVEPTTEDDITFVLEFDPPIGNGEVGVRFDVISADGHPVTGSFSFTIDDPTPESTDPDPTDPQTPDSTDTTTTTAAPASSSATISPETTDSTTTSPSTVSVGAPETDEVSEITVVAVASTPSTAPADDDDDEDGDATTSVIVVLVILSAVAAAVGGVIYARKRSGTPPVDPSPKP
jgi:methionine-rich copper-binding protein CopC